MKLVLLALLFLILSALAAVVFLWLFEFHSGDDGCECSACMMDRQMTGERIK